MRWFVIVMLFKCFGVFSTVVDFEEHLSSRLVVIKILCDSGQEPALCNLWNRITEAKVAHDTALNNWNRLKERLEHRYTTAWDDYMGSLCEGLEDDSESIENEPFIYFCETRAQLAKARETLSEAQTLPERMKVIEGVEGALNRNQEEQNVCIIEERYNIIKKSLTNTICDRRDEFPEAADFCASLVLVRYEERVYQEKRVLLESMDAGRMDYKIRQFCKPDKYQLPPCDKL